MPEPDSSSTIQPIMLATWSFGAPALAAAWPVLISADGGALAAVEAAGRHAEADLTNHTVGVGGLPDRDGVVSLDAAIMLAPNWRGGVCDVRTYAHPISIARRVAERTPHTLLAGRGAEAFAADQGFAPATLLTDSALSAWRQRSNRQTAATADASSPSANFEESRLDRAADRNELHDTIGILGLDASGTLAAGCTTSGLPWKLPSRVGDSPIIGHGLYVDPQIGACVCTGHGELVSGICGAFLAVESLRRGETPQKAAERVIERIRSAFTLTERDQVGVLVLNASGQHGAASIRDGFKFAIRNPVQQELITVNGLADHC